MEISAIKDSLLLSFVNNKFNGMKFNNIDRTYNNEISKYILLNYRTIQEGVYCIVNDEVPYTCASCDNIANFVSIYKGYGKYCSNKCVANRTSKDVKHLKDYSIIEITRSFTLYTKDEVLDKIKYVFNSKQQIISRISIKDIALKDINLYFSIMHYTSFLQDEATLSQRLYHLFNNIFEKSLCRCNKELLFYSFKRGYSDYCSIKCASNDEKIVLKRRSNRSITDKEWQEKMRKTYEDKTGFSHNMHNSEVKDKIKKSKIEKYGEDYADILFLKSSETYEKATGYKTPFNNPKIINHTQQILRDNREEITQKQKKTWKDRYSLDRPISKHLKNLDKILDKEFIQSEFLFEDKTLNLEKMQTFFNCKANWCFKILRENGVCYEKSKSRMENELYDYLKNTLLIEDIKINDRKFIKPLEIDILMNNLAIELDGLYYHSYSVNDKEDKNYHLNKTRLCEEKGLQLFHIFENEWIDKEKRQIWLSIISNKLSLNSKIFARKCSIKEVQSKEAAEFLDLNHIQGACSASINIGLYFSDELVSLMTFSKPRFNKNYDFELIRFCNKINISVIGGASKLLSYFRKNYKGSIISYANRRWSQGDLYEKLGFSKIAEAKPNYFYFKTTDLVLHSRVKFQKHKLTHMKNYDVNKTESQIMFEEGYRKIYDCGNIVYALLEE